MAQNLGLSWRRWRLRSNFFLLIFLVVKSVNGFLATSCQKGTWLSSLPRNYSTAVSSSKNGSQVDLKEILTEDEIATLDDLVEKRSTFRWKGDYREADLIRRAIEERALPDGYHIILRDIPRAEGGGSTWTLGRKIDRGKRPLLEGPSILQLAHAALGLTVHYGAKLNLLRAKEHLQDDGISFRETNSEDNDWSLLLLEKEHSESLKLIEKRCVARLLKHPDMVNVELTGRKAADAAFWFAMAGVKDPFIFEALVEISTQEMLRFGSRSSCRSKDIRQIVDRFAASGIRSASSLEKVAQQILKEKDEMCKEERHGCEGRTSLLRYHSDHSLLLVWKFSTKQKKQHAFLKQAMKHWERNYEVARIQPNHIPEGSKGLEPFPMNKHEWRELVEDPNLPLVIDIGCGMGASVLGLATTKTGSTVEADYAASVLLGPSTSWEDCNFLGVDLGLLGITCARGICSRWGLEGRVAFVVDSAEGLLQQVSSDYPGSVELCCIQFPTPYRLSRSSLLSNKATSTDNNEVASDSDGRGNSQLPTSAKDGFMVTGDLLASISKVLHQTSPSGKFLFQSNCEDVAVGVQAMACEYHGFRAINIPEPNFESLARRPVRIPKRTEDWIALGGSRARGAAWAAHPILHAGGCSETERSCVLNGNPVHRCVLSVQETLH